MKPVAVLLVLATAALVLTAAWKLRPAEMPFPTAGRVARAGEAAESARAALLAARRTCRAEELDRFIEAERRRIERLGRKVEDLRLLAEALVERVQTRAHLFGVEVGKPVFDELPPEVARDLEEGLSLIREAREAGDDSCDNYRIEAALLGNEITGLGSALALAGRIREALDAAAARDRNEPRLQMAMGLQKLFAPRFLGHDPRAALQHLEFAAASLPDDERPAIFAGMAAYLLRQREKAISWLERAIERNPANLFAKVVLDRLRRGEERPFERDVTAEEASSTR
ncbi:MAG: hypothetical protein Fur0037_16080 [Planctomycetota bacterium]